MSNLHPWIVQPFFFICAVWFFYQNPISVKNYTPDLLFGLWQNVNHSQNPWGLSDVFPQFPTDQKEIFHLGELFGQLGPIENDTNFMNESKNSIYMQKIACILQIKQNLQMRDLIIIRTALIEVATQGTLFSRIVGLFSFINVLWFISICGIIILFYPCAVTVFGPIIEQLGKMIIDFFIFINPAIEPGSYFLTYFIIVQGCRYEPEVGFFISLTGCLIFAALLYYSDYKHSVYCDKETKNLKKQLFFLTLSIVWAPIAIFYQSKMIGFLTVGAFFSFLGFTIICLGLCWLIGYENEYFMHRSSVSSILLMMVTILIKLKIIVIPNMLWIEPFSTGILTFGMISYFLAALIISSKHYDKRKATYSGQQLIMIVSLLIAVFIGSVYQFAPLYNIGLTFAVIYFLEKIYEIELQKFLVVALFFTCVIIYFISMYLRTHTDFIMTMFDASL